MLRAIGLALLFIAYVVSECWVGLVAAALRVFP